MARSMPTSRESLPELGPVKTAVIYTGQCCVPLDIFDCVMECCKCRELRPCQSPTASEACTSRAFCNKPINPAKDSAIRPNDKMSPDTGGLHGAQRRQKPTAQLGHICRTYKVRAGDSPLPLAVCLHDEHGYFSLMKLPTGTVYSPAGQMPACVNISRLVRRYHIRSELLKQRSCNLSVSPIEGCATPDLSNAFMTI